MEVTPISVAFGADDVPGTTKDANIVVTGTTQPPDTVVPITLTVTYGSESVDSVVNVTIDNPNLTPTAVATVPEGSPVGVNIGAFAYQGGSAPYWYAPVTFTLN